MQFQANNQPIAKGGRVRKSELLRFDIKQPVWYASFNWKVVEALVRNNNIQSRDLPKQLPVYRDLAMIVPKGLQYQAVEDALMKPGLSKLKEIKLFDIFESEKLGPDKKSLAINITFLDEEKTLTDIEIDSMMSQLMGTLEKDLHAEIRK